MKKTFVVAISCLLLTAGLSFGQTASFSFNDNNGTPDAGTYNPNDTFTVDVSGTATGFTADGYSLWLEVPTTNGFNTTINITAGTFVQFTDPTESVYPKLFIDTSGQRDAGYRTDKQGTLNGDLGASSNAPAEQFTGTARLASYTFTFTGAPPGTYVMYLTTISPKRSGLSSDTFAFFSAAACSCSTSAP